MVNKTSFYLANNVPLLGLFRRNSFTSNDKQTLQQDWKISKDLSFASVEIDKNCWLTLPRWRSLCHSLARDQLQPESFFQRPGEAEKRDPGNEVDHLSAVLVSSRTSFCLCSRRIENVSILLCFASANVPIDLIFCFFLVHIFHDCRV